MSEQPTARVVTVSDPAAEATAYAQRLGADVARDRDAVEQAIADRIDAARLVAVAEPDDEELLDRAGAIRAAAGTSPVGDVELVRLRQLAAELARAERIRAHTERRVAQRAAATADPAPAPPEPLVDEARRTAATAVVTAESERDAAEAALAAAEAAVTDDRAEPNGGPSDDELIAAWEAALDANEAAQTAVSTAWQRWNELAGPEADPRDPAAILLEAPPLDEPSATSPTLAAVTAFHRKVQARWRVQWAAVGGGEPPEPELLDVAIEGLDGRRRRASDDVVRLEAAEQRAGAAAVLARPLVIVEPRKWAAADDLGQLLGRLPGSAQVIVIERRSAWAS